MHSLSSTVFIAFSSPYTRHMYFTGHLSDVVDLRRAQSTSWQEDVYVAMDRPDVERARNHVPRFRRRHQGDAPPDGARSLGETRVRARRPRHRVHRLAA